MQIEQTKMKIIVFFMMLKKKGKLKKLVI